MPRALLALAVLGVLAVPSVGADRPGARTTTTTLPAPPPDPNLATAREALLVAQDQLRSAGAGKPDVYGGHRKLALELVNTALEQVESGLRLAQEAARAAQEKEKQKPTAAPKRRRR
jgi:hypothetical protein